jgi:hypothetical protein
MQAATKIHKPNHAASLPRVAYIFCCSS